MVLARTLATVAAILAVVAIVLGVALTPRPNKSASANL